MERARGGEWKEEDKTREKSWQYIPNKKYSLFFCTDKIKWHYQSHVSLGSLGIDQSQSQTPSLSAGRSAEDDTFADRSLSMTRLEWNPQPCFARCQKRRRSTLFFDKTRHKPSLNLIGLWSDGKTKAANLSVVHVWTALDFENASQVFWGAGVQQKFEKHDSHILGLWCHAVFSGLKSSLEMRLGSALMWGLSWCDFSMPRASAVLCHPLPQRLTWELPAAETQPFIPGDYKLKMRRR